MVFVPRWVFTALRPHSKQCWYSTRCQFISFAEYLVHDVTDVRKPFKIVSRKRVENFRTKFIRSDAKQRRQNDRKKHCIRYTLTFIAKEHISVFVCLPTDMILRRIEESHNNNSAIWNVSEVYSLSISSVWKIDCNVSVSIAVMQQLTTHTTNGLQKLCNLCNWTETFCLFCCFSSSCHQQTNDIWTLTVEVKPIITDSIILDVHVPVHHHLSPSRSLSLEFDWINRFIVN